MGTIRNILVIGAGPAGTFAAIAAKKQDPAATVRLLSAESCEPYEKPPLSKAVLIGTALPGDAPIAGPGGVAAHGVVLESCAPCRAIDRRAHEVVLEDGRRLAYDTLVVATGAVARELPHLPAGTPRVHYLRTEADAHALAAALRPGQDLLVVGAGLIGLEVAAAAAELGGHVTVLETATRILSRVCDEETGAVIHAAHRQRGVDIRLGSALVSATPQGDGRLAVATSVGEPITVDVVVVGVGAKPDDRLAVNAELRTDNGIVVDEQCRTSDATIFAAGDVACFPSPHGSARLENWRHSLDQGSVAGRNAAGASDAYLSLPSFWSEQYDLYLQGVGWPIVGRERVQRPLPGNAALVFEVHQGLVTYAMGLNARRELAIARRLIEQRVPITPAALADPAQPLASILKGAK